MHQKITSGLLPCLLALSLAASTTAQFGGNGSDGPLTPTSNITLGKNTNDGVFNFTDIVIPKG